MVRVELENGICSQSNIFIIVITVSGGYGGGATPDPIPNSEVKPSCADGTAWVTMWESRSPPELFFIPSKVVPLGAAFRRLSRFSSSLAISVSIHRKRSSIFIDVYMLMWFLLIMKKAKLGLLEELNNTLAPLKESWKAVGYVTAALMLLLIYLHQGSSVFFIEIISKSIMHESRPLDVQWWGVVYQHASAFILFMIIPLLYLKIVERRKLSEIGLGLGDWRFGFKVVVPAGILLIAIPAALSAAFIPDFIEEYPLAKLAYSNPEHFVVYELVYGILYYTAYEAFFRGMLQFSLKERIGVLGAILVQTAITTLLHIGKPQGEIWSALFAGLIFGALAFRLRSVWPLWIIHFSLGLFTDLFCSMAGG